MIDLLSHDWRTVPLAILDVETTGLGVQTDHENGDRTTAAGDDRIVEIAVVRFVPGNPDPVQIECSLVNPGRPIPAEASAIHGITDADVANAPSFRDAWAAMLPVLEGAAVGAYNAPYDRGFVAHHVRELAPGTRVPANVRAPWLDPCVWIRVIDRFVKGSGRHKLRAACERWKVPEVDWHRASADAEASGRLLRAMEPDLARYCPDPSLRTILERQTALGRADSLRFREWLSRQPPRERKEGA